MSNALLGLIAAGLLVLGLGAAGCSSDAGTRAERIERQLLVSCSCHPKKIDGLPLEGAIRETIREGIAAGQSDDEILWAALMAHGNALLSAGVEDVEVRAAAAIAGTGLALLLALGVLLMQVGRERR